VTAAVAALICRLSPRDDADYAGVKDQERAGRRYADSKWPGVPVEVFADEGKSATKGDYRPGLERFLDRLAEGRVAHVWAVEQSRVSRETDGRYPWFKLAALMEAAGVAELHTDRDGIVRLDDVVAGIKAVISEGEVRVLTRRVNDKKDAAREAGNLRTLLGGVPVLGYQYRDGDGDWTIEPGAAELLQYVATAVLDDPEHRVRTAYERAMRVSRFRAVTDAAGRPVSEKMLRAALRRPATGGLIKERDVTRKDPATGRRVLVRRGAVTGRAAVDAPLDERTWRELQAVFDGRKAGRRVTGDRYDLGPLLRCGKCGNQLTGELARGVPYYACRNPHPKLGIWPKDKPGLTHPCRGVSIAAGQVDAMVRAAVEAWAATPGSGFAAASQVRAGLAGEREKLTAELAEARRRHSELAEGYAAGDIDPDLWAGIVERWRVKRDRLEAEIAALAGVLAEPPLPAEVRWDALAGDERRRLVGRALEVPIRVAPGRGGGRPLTADQRITLRARI
jgi:DNA invertase Pin-like site-specific DNA recombinase